MADKGFDISDYLPHGVQPVRIQPLPLARPAKQPGQQAIMPMPPAAQNCEAKKNLSQENAPKNNLASAAAEDEQEILLSLLHKKKSPSIDLSTFNGHAEDYIWKKCAEKKTGFPPPLKDIIKVSNGTLVGDYVHITENQIDALEKATLGQTDTMLWHEQRVGRITASKAHQVLNKKQKIQQSPCSRDMFPQLSPVAPSPCNYVGGGITKKMLLAHTKR
eukprot:gene14504-16012_t